ncbi:Signal transducer regulating beta-lactamase production, contains metallopeptidase domain [Flavobacterium aquidurense]|uniref:Peptidase M56 n=1 Tax=Flavobacterium frigidimaris TaxID=262320 RepID=A0ABX4BUY9_FLAFR|nr:M56 family metallopeptidase [Flavobacterium frigidimaris]OXA81707.1 peptidase M56 [Flavobacterium frigidimaris]SDZ54596.1 Signal transducer regulating beta-lactamase production, contains metallopeptidase domain [Flavobacterium aquidurense]
METLFIFIAKSSGLVILFYFAYFFLLRKETFFSSNRWFLLAGLITSLVLPFVVYTKIVWVDPTPMPAAMNYAAAFIPNTNTIPEETFEINWNYVALVIYSIGFLALIIKFATDFYSLNSVLKGREIQQEADFKFIDIKENIAPFSYFDYIVYNSSLYSAAELESILEHEKVHSDQNHTVDVIISRIFCVLFWFNPIIWLYKKAILQNLEFIADYEASKKIADKKAYQYTLLKITTHETCVAITNHFYQSLIKKRIVMLNKNQSKKTNYWKYCTIIPALAAFVFLFQIEVIAQEKKETQEIAKTTADDVYKIEKTTTDQELKVIAEKIKQKHNFDVAISNVKRNTNKELTAIKMNIKKGTQEVQTIQIDGEEAIKSFGLVVSTEGDNIKKIGVVTDGETNKSMMLQDRIADVDEVNSQDVNEMHVAPPAPPAPPARMGNIAPPAPPVAPAFPGGSMPKLPSIDMSKMPKAPAPPANPRDKVAMANFEKKMAEFEKKMEAFEPTLSAYEKQVNEIMSKHEALYGKDMEKYEIAMEKFSVDMDKYAKYIEETVGKDMKDYEKNMKEYEKDMKAYEKEMKKLDKESRKS